MPAGVRVLPHRGGTLPLPSSQGARASWQVRPILTILLCNTRVTPLHAFDIFMHAVNAVIPHMCLLVSLSVCLSVCQSVCVCPAWRVYGVCVCVDAQAFPTRPLSCTCNLVCSFVWTERPRVSACACVWSGVRSDPIVCASIGCMYVCVSVCKHRVAC